MRSAESTSLTTSRSTSDVRNVALLLAPCRSTLTFAVPSSRRRRSPHRQGRRRHAGLRTLLLPSASTIRGLGLAIPRQDTDPPVHRLIALLSSTPSLTRTRRPRQTPPSSPGSLILPSGLPKPCPTKLRTQLCSLPLSLPLDLTFYDPTLSPPGEPPLLPVALISAP